MLEACKNSAHCAHAVHLCDNALTGTKPFNTKPFRHICGPPGLHLSQRQLGHSVCKIWEKARLVPRARTVCPGTSQGSSRGQLAQKAPVYERFSCLIDRFVGLGGFCTLLHLEGLGVEFLHTLVTITE